MGTNNNVIEIKQDDNIYEVYENDIMILCDEYIDSLSDPDMLYNNKGCFTGLIKYINRKLITNILDNKNRTANRYNDIQLLDNLFNIYCQLCYKYNNNPTILEYSLFIGISRDTITDWKNGTNRNVTPEYIHTVKNWFQECELAQVKGTDVKSIFLLKSCYNYNDNLQQIPLENQERQSSIDALPTFAIEDNKGS